MSDSEFESLKTRNHFHDTNTRQLAINRCKNLRLETKQGVCHNHHSAKRHPCTSASGQLFDAQLQLKAVVQDQGKFSSLINSFD